ncbi:hypothetical protein TGPRC2_219780 [Toxoplasma gondii TgCatPRC2]|uniref:Uncharacterized protein n=1 Tax=Toxoplasma gondii TgCatPRC2 TaxID=1130821 RepID=A0A151HD28_TOXGO|nr:hypothetical protein TGPRC2_219780 [Toxoplasma gondii TgCatPRC2]
MRELDDREGRRRNSSAFLETKRPSAAKKRPKRRPREKASKRAEDANTEQKKEERSKWGERRQSKDGEEETVEPKGEVLLEIQEREEQGTTKTAREEGKEKRR